MTAVEQRLRDAAEKAKAATARGPQPWRWTWDGDALDETTAFIAACDPQTILTLLDTIHRYEEVVKAARRWRHVPDFNPHCVFCGVESWPHTTYNGVSCPIGDLCTALATLDFPGGDQVSGKKR